MLNDFNDVNDVFFCYENTFNKMKTYRKSFLKKTTSYCVKGAQKCIHISKTCSKYLKTLSSKTKREIIKFQTFIFQGLDGAWLRHYSWRCQPVDWTDNPMAMRVSSSTVSWYLVGFAKNPFAFFFSPIRTRTGRPRLLRVLPGQDLRAAGHGVLHAAQKGQPDQLPAPVPPHRDADDLVGCHQVLPGRTRHLYRFGSLFFLAFSRCSSFLIVLFPNRSHQLVRPHRDVHVLHVRGHGSPVPQVPLVEEVHH